MSSLKKRFWEVLDIIRGSASDEAFMDKCVERAIGAPTSPRILFVGLKYDYGIPRRGLSSEENNFVHALAGMGYEVLGFDAGLSRRWDRRRTSRLLWEAVIRYKPLLMFTVLFKDELEPRVVEEISQHSGTVTLNGFCDDHWNKIIPKYEELFQKLMIR